MKQRRISFSVPAEFEEEIKEYCRSNDLKISSTLRKAFRLYKHHESLGKV